MNNYQWLLQMDGADRKAWFDAEHVETANGTLDGDTELQNADSREQLEADARKIADAYNMDSQRHGTERFAHELYYSIIHLLDRQRALSYEVCDECSKEYYELQDEVNELTQIAESKRVSFADRIRFVNQIDELTAERDNLKANNEQLHTLAGEQAAKIDELQSALDAICANLSIIATGEPNVIADIAIETIEELIDECNTANRHCNEYRNKFGKCLDYADAIHALMDEGMA